MGTGPNNCPGILRGKDTIEGERGGKEERRRRGRRGWERKEGRFGVRVVLDSKQRGQFKMRQPTATKEISWWVGATLSH